MRKYINYAKKLGNTPPNICTPEYLYRAALKLTQRNKAVTLSCNYRVKDYDKMELFHAVAKGSSECEHFIVIEYTGRKGSR